MKKRLPKKILAAFLAAMMVVTSVPFSAITAFAANGYVDVATDAKVQAVETSMKKFQSELAKDKSYSNVVPAYKAYVACQQGLDAYIYGGESNALDGLADKLDTAVAGMTEFTGIKANTGKYRQVKVYADDDTGFDEATYLKDGYQNVLWLETGINTDNNDGKQSKDTYSALTLYYPSATLLYDDETTPATSVMAVATGEGGWKGGTDRYISAITLENAKDGINISRNWRGGSSNLDFNWSWYWNGNKYNLSNNTTTAGNVYQIRKGGTLAVYKNYQQYFSNFMEYTGDPGNKYIVSFVPTFKGHIGSKNDFATNINDPASPTVPGSTAINVVNYKIVKEAIKAAGNKMKSKDLSTYSMGGLYTYFAAMDDATSFDPNTFFTSSNDTSGYVKAASGKVQAINAASIDVTNDTKANYQSLRDAMGIRARSTYAEGNDNNKYYTDKSWKAFEDAYKASQAFMAKVDDDTFTNADSVYKANEEAKVYADALNAAYAGLKTSVDKADTSALVALIQKFESYNSNVFTAETYNAALETVKNIKIAVWGSVDNYGVPAYAPNDDEAGRAKVTTAVEEYNAAFAALRINPDAVVFTESGSYSLNQAIDLEKNIKDPADYSNYATFATALNDAKLAKENLATTPMTDYDTQYDAYVAAIDTLVKAYNALQYSFTKIPDGTVFGNGGTNEIKRMSLIDKGGQYIEGSFTNQGYILRTKHTPLQVKFGDFNVTLGVIYKQSDAFQLLKNNALDSITINATQPKIADNTSEGGEVHLTSNSNSTPNALSDEQKANYAGCLSYTQQSKDGKDYTYSVSNLRYTGRNNVNDSPHVITLNDGTEVKDYSQAIATNLDTVLGTTDGGSNNPVPGAVFARSNDGKNGGEAYVKGDFNFTAPATEQQTLTATSYPSYTTYTLGTKFGAVTAWNCRNFSNFCGYNWFTSEMNNQVLNPAVQIVDITPLVELVDECNTYLPNSNMYTDESWAAFTQALERAQGSVDLTQYNDTNKLNQLMTRLKQKYTQLWNAKEGLVVKTLNVTFNYKDSTGSDATLVLPVTYGEKLSKDQIDEFNAKVPLSYVDSKNYTYNLEDFEPTFNKDAAVTADVTYTAKYDEGTPNAASWTEFNSAKEALIAKLQSPSKFTATALESVKAAIAKLPYFNFTSEQQAEIKADNQNLIDSQKNKMLQLAESLTAIEINDDVAKAVNEAQAAANKNDYDMYDKLGDNFKVTKDVTFDVINPDLTDGTQLTVKGYLYSTQKELDSAIRAALEGLSLKTYDIYVNGKRIDTVAYGTPVSVIPTKIISTTSTTAKGDGANYSWTYSFTAPSRDPNFGTATQNNEKYLTAEKYMITAPSFGFIVKGETHLTATQVNGEKAGYTVTFKSGVNGKIINVLNTDASGNFEMPTAPSVPYYTFESYSIDVAPGASATVTKDTVITVNYKAVETDNITIDVYYSAYDFENGENIDTYTKSYNSLISLSNDNAYVWTKAVFDENTSITDYTVLAYGTAYSFYAAESMTAPGGYIGLVALTKDEYDSLVTKQTSKGHSDIFYPEPSTDDTINHVLKGDGTFILANVEKTTGNVTVGELLPDVSSLENLIFTADNSKFSLIGTFVKPTGYKMVETGFLVTQDTTATQGDLTVENVGNKGVARLKASKYTVGNQFVINIKNSPSTKEFKYVSYLKYEDKNGNIVTTYGKVLSATTSGHELK